jgi:hypothetical protein
MRQRDGCREGALLHLAVDIQLEVQGPSKKEEEEALTRGKGRPRRWGLTSWERRGQHMFHIGIVQLMCGSLIQRISKIDQLIVLRGS